MKYIIFILLLIPIASASIVLNSDKFNVPTNNTSIITINLSEYIYTNYTLPALTSNYEYRYVTFDNLSTWHVCGAINNNTDYYGFFNLDCAGWNKSNGYPCLPHTQLEYWGSNEYFCRFTQTDRLSNVTFPRYRNLNHYKITMFYVSDKGLAGFKELNISFVDSDIVTYRE